MLGYSGPPNMARRRALIVVPCFNEEAALPALLDRFEESLRPLADTHEIDILVVDDGSVDSTSEVARKRGVRVARLRRNLGIGGAVQTGLRLAARQGYDCAMQVDGDGQHPPSEIPGLLATLDLPEPPDLVIGSRFVGEARDAEWKTTALRRVGIGWLSFVLRTFVHVDVADPTSGFRVYGRRALDLFDDNYPYDFPEPESLAIARAAGLKILEVPVKMQARQGGASSIRGFATAYYMLKVTLAVLLTFARSTKPWRRPKRDM